MKNKTFGYTEDWKTSPMAYWVHIEADDKPWYISEKFDPPAPVRHGSLGYPYLTIELDGFRFSFTSEAQFEEFKTIMLENYFLRLWSFPVKDQEEKDPIVTG
ncbi:hypothetical protein JCM19314_937 [Nonlabens ulvanivorans]|uniref:Uncharacterized protein n=1 Tax=Nonlabens ulvanivorans TaxID=906888 RepID=A0A090QC04_NONUL|nr:hypothetical protein [Nonlabens ulvanivorans]GAK99752.1 hypothetical protein JCM19314_937 [Nonlabens ulvanivorans]